MSITTDKIQASNGKPVKLAHQSALQMWANFDATQSIVRNSLNVSSLTDHATGAFEFEMVSPMTSPYYHLSYGAKRENSGFAAHSLKAEAFELSASRIRLMTADGDRTQGDAQFNHICAAGELA